MSITSTKCSARFGYSLVGPNWLIMWFGGESLPTQFFLEWRSWRFQRTQLTHVICCGRNTVQRTYISLFYHWGGETLYTVSVSDYSWWKQVDSRTICWKQESSAQNPKNEKTILDWQQTKKPTKKKSGQYSRLNSWVWHGRTGSPRRNHNHLGTQATMRTAGKFLQKTKKQP